MDGGIGFRDYADFRNQFLQRFADLNPTGTVLTRLIKLRQGRIGIQKYLGKAENLTALTTVGKTAAKAFIFNRLNTREKDITMLANAHFSEEDLERESLRAYRARLAQVLRRQELRRGEFNTGSAEGEDRLQSGNSDPIDLDVM